jgi:hypothetical protein
MVIANYAKIVLTIAISAMMPTLAQAALVRKFFSRMGSVLPATHSIQIVQPVKERTLV